MHDVSGKLKVTRCGYASDSFDNVYYGAKKIENAQGKIKCIGGGYGIDRQGNKFYKGEQVDSAPSRFGEKNGLTHVGGGYALSAQKAFYRGKPFDKARCKNIRPLA